MSIPNKNTKKTQKEDKNSVLRACLYEFCFSPLGTTATSIRNQYEKKTNVATTKSTFGLHFNAKVHIENHGLMSLDKIREEVILILSKDVNGNEPYLERLKEKTQKILDQIFATKQGNIMTQHKQLHKSNRLLTDDEENFLVQLCKCLAYSGWEVLSVINEIAPLPNKQSHSIHALNNFMKRHPDLSVIKSSGVDDKHAAQANEYVRDVYFSKLDAYIHFLHSMGQSRWKNFSEIPAKFKYNMDEVGSNTTRQRGPTVGPSEDDRKRLFTITPEGDKMPFHVTMCLTIRSDGQYNVQGDSIYDGAPPPIIIHSRKGEDRNPEDVCTRLKTGLVDIKGTSGCSNMDDAFQQKDKYGFLVLATPNGSMTQKAMFPYAKHFVKNLPINRKNDEPVILFLDGHSSRWDIPTLDYFFKNNVFPFLLPSHTSIWLQPNDCGPNKRLHSCLGEAAQGSRSGNVGKRFEAKDWNKIFRQGWELFLTREQNDWKHQGSNTASFAYVKTGRSGKSA
jgi:hypothetical protein